MRLPGAEVAFSTRLGGVSEGPYESLNLGILTDDERERVERNRELLAAAAGVDGRSIAMGWQVHGTDVKEWDGAAGRRRAREGGRPRHGAATTSRCSCSSPTACRSRSRAATGSRWSTAAGAASPAGSSPAPSRHFDEPPAAAVGPGIGACCYEVGDEVRASQFDARFADGRMLDLRAVADDRLRAAGVETVEHVDLCTSCRERPLLLAPPRRRA